MPLSEKAARSRDRNFRIPQMQHRHFAFIAGCIRNIPTPSARVEATATFHNALKRSNPAFDGYRFDDACGCEADQYTLAELDQAIAYATYWLDHLTSERKQRGLERPAIEAAE